MSSGHRKALSSDQLESESMVDDAELIKESCETALVAESCIRRCPQRNMVFQTTYYCIFSVELCEVRNMDITPCW